MTTTRKPNKLNGIAVIVIIVSILVITISTCDGCGEDEQIVMTRKDSIEKMFSAYDGSCIEFALSIKHQLNDEDSYDHIKTVYYDLKNPMAFNAFRNQQIDFCESAGLKDTTINALYVISEFRAKNGFNAIIKCSAWGLVSVADGKVLYTKINN